MNPSPLNDPALLAILSAIAGTIGGICVWIYQHTRRCHRGQTPAQVKLAQQEAAELASREMHMQDELARLSAEIGHAGDPGTILGRQHHTSKSLREVRTTLGMPADPQS